MIGYKVLMNILVLILIIHYICIILIPKWRIKFFKRYIAMDITKKHEIIDQRFNNVLEKTWYIKQPMIIIMCILLVVLVDYSDNAFVYIALFSIFAEHLYILCIIHYGKKKGFFRKI
ncbi:MAG: hypothetical protein LUG60_09115 [Erysipelotrichaceae bacterium]|nr:hypothetical protein [Erysipelotrichaceae bacterium]